MSTLTKVISNIVTRTALDPEVARMQQISREWEYHRSRAVSPSERAEIDAIFARAS